MMRPFTLMIATAYMLAEANSTDLIPALINQGGFAVVAAMLFVLHRDALKTFKDEMQAERKANADVANQQSEAKAKDHAEVMQVLSIQGQVLARLEERTQPK